MQAQCRYSSYCSVSAISTAANDEAAMMMMIVACSISVASSVVRFFFRFDEIYLCLARKLADSTAIMMITLYVE